ncbi:LLM class F420-dependent oxidoreductase [Jatrophihabitans sp. DSM 45814]
MKLALHVNNFTWDADSPGGTTMLGPKLAEIAQTAERVGFARLSVMDHVWQIRTNGPKEHEMLEAYTALGFLAAHTTSVDLLTLVTGVTYRSPGLLAKAVTTLDVLSGGRAWLGIGAAWNEAEAAGLGLGYGPTAERFERLEEAIQICLQMWSDDNSPFTGKHYNLTETLNSPQPLAKPRPRIMIGGAGERKTLRLVAKYADACNIFAGPEAAHKLEVLREHCEREGRDYTSIEKTALLPLAVDAEGGVTGLLDRLRVAHELGFTVVHGAVAGVAAITPLEVLGSEVIPEVGRW